MHLPAEVYPVLWSGAHKMYSACHEETVQDIYLICSVDNRSCYNAYQNIIYNKNTYWNFDHYFFVIIYFIKPNKWDCENTFRDKSSHDVYASKLNILN